MMLTGFLKKSANAGWWYAECDVIGVAAQGKSRKDAASSLAEAIEVKIGRDDFTARVCETGPGEGGAIIVIVTSDRPEVLAAEVLKHQRTMNKLTLAAVAKKLGVSSISSYAAYEQGTRAPTLAKFQELLAAVAPEMVMTVGPRKAVR